MKNLILITFIALIFSVEIKAQDSTSSEKKDKFVKVGFSERSFNNSRIEDVGAMLGLEVSYGLEVQKNLTASLFASSHWKTLSETEDLGYHELAIWFDYHPANFYIGAAPVFVSIVLDEEIIRNSQSVTETSSKNGIGIEGRIGYSISLFRGVELYIEAKYSKVNIDSDADDKWDIGTAGFSIGFLL
jgi:hypothetical protein